MPTDNIVNNRLKQIQLTQNQLNVFEKFKNFLKNTEQRIFILRGYAGTGKTTLVRFFIDEMRKSELNYILMASTGRAAKILSNATHLKASTVHSVIYSFKDFNQDLEEIVKQEDETGVDKTGQLFLTFELIPMIEDEKQRIYVIDEASMISDVKDETANQALFGSGKLLTDLMSYDKYGKFVFVGDECQLPPIGQDISPALSADYFKSHFGLDAIDTSLTEIVRQEQGNTIIQASHRIRQLYSNPPKVKWGTLPLGSYQHIQLYPDVVSMINTYLSLIKQHSYDKASFIASSNNKCKAMNTLIRSSLGRSQELQAGDLLLVTQNNIISGFMNGDMVVIEQVKPVRHYRAQLSFQLVKVRELVTGRVFSQFIIEDILHSNITNLTQAQQKALFIDFYRRMRTKGIEQKDLLFKEMLNTDEYLNALRCVYGYTITCHKAQGGEWDEVCIDIPRNLTLNAKATDYQWIYTAVTRAKKRLHLVKDFFIGR
ncbi:MAG TPA: AAA family ATPase [Bacteroidales bacterium]|nr:AAA family ATPase [Bacteroidales bacterium]